MAEAPIIQAARRRRAAQLAALGLTEPATPEPPIREVPSAPYENDAAPVDEEEGKPVENGQQARTGRAAPKTFAEWMRRS